MGRPLIIGGYKGGKWVGAMQPFIHPRHGKIMVTDHVHFLIEKDKREACPQRTPGWYEKRNNHLTASAIATACGANPYEKVSTLIKRKTGRAPAFKGNEATEHGNKYEDVAIEKYEHMTGQKVIDFGLLESLNDGEEFIAGSPDGITASGRCIEVKCPYRRKPTEVVPEHYVYQVQTIMHTQRLDCCDFIQFVPETTWSEEIFIITHIKYDPYFWSSKFPILQRVWQEILDIREMQEKGTFVEAPEPPPKSRRVNKGGSVIDISEPEPPTECLIDVEKDPPSRKLVPMEEDPDGDEEKWKGLSAFFDAAVAEMEANPPPVRLVRKPGAPAPAKLLISL